MTEEHPPRYLGDEYETGILKFTMEGPDIVEAGYVAAAEGPDGYLAGYSDTLEEADKVDGPPDGINGWTTIGFAYVDLEEIDPDDVDEVWGDGVVLRTTDMDRRQGIVEVRYSQMEDKWWTVPAYIETDPE